MSRRIRTRHGTYNLAANTIRLGVKSVRVGGRNVWKQTKDKLEKLSEEAETHSGENQAIARVQKRILCHAPQSIRMTAKASKGAIKLVAKGTAKAGRFVYRKATGAPAPSKARKKVKTSMPRRIRARVWSMTKEGAKRVVVRSKNAGIKQAKNVIRTEQEQAAKTDARNYASGKAEQAVAKVAPKAVKASRKIVRLGIKGVWTISRKATRFAMAGIRERFKNQAKQQAKDMRSTKHKNTESNELSQQQTAAEAQQKKASVAEEQKKLPHKNNEKVSAQKQQSNTNRSYSSTGKAKHDPNKNGRIKQANRQIHSKPKQTQFRTSTLRNQSRKLHTRADQKAVTAINKQSIMTKQGKAAAIKKAKSKAAKQVTSRAAQQAKAAAIQVMKRSAKVLEQTLKAIATAVKAIIAAVGGGAFFIGLVVLIAGAAFIFASPWGLFFGSEAPETHHIPQVVAELNAELLGTVQSEQTGTDDELDMEGDSIVSNWVDVLGVFAVKTSTNMTNPLDVGTMDDEKKAILKQVFLDMNEVVTTQETITETDGDGNQTTKTINKTSIVSKTWQEIIPIFGFNDEQEKLLTELMQGEFYEMFVLLLGLDPAQATPLTPEELAIITQDLPAGAQTSEIVKMALSKLGTTYSNKKRMQEGYYDCSSLVYRIYKSFGLEVGYPDSYVAASQAQWCVNNNVVVSYNDLQAGDLVFFSSKPSKRFLSIDHVGIYAGNGKIIDASSSRGKVVYRDIWTSTLVLCGRPSVKLN